MSRGNCLPLEAVPILTATNNYLSSYTLDPPSVTQINETVSKSRIVDPDVKETADHDYVYIPHPSHLAQCTEKIVAYIAGFVVFQLKSRLTCEKCISALSVTDDDADDSIYTFIKHKTQGGLVCPSKDVIKICITCERFFRQNVALPYGKLSTVSCHDLLQSVLKTFLGKTIFDTLNEHMLECDPADNHLILLIKAIAEKYLQVRYHYAGKHCNSTLFLNKSKKLTSRHIHTKLVIFGGQ